MLGDVQFDSLQPPTEQTQQIKILIVEDMAILRSGLRLILDQMPECILSGEARDGETALKLAMELKPDLVLLDLGLPGMDGIDVLRCLKRLLQTRVLMLTAIDSTEKLLEAMSAGADGYCLKYCTDEQLETAVRATVRGDTWIDPCMAVRLFKAEVKRHSNQTGHNPSLSVRELEVLALVVDGLSNREMADRLFLSPDTVKSHLRRIMEKLGVHDRTQAAVRAIKEGLLAARG